jgi:hypothetical protein
MIHFQASPDSGEQVSTREPRHDIRNNGVSLRKTSNVGDHFDSLLFVHRYLQQRKQPDESLFVSGTAGHSQQRRYHGDVPVSGLRRTTRQSVLGHREQGLRVPGCAAGWAMLAA